MNQGIRLVKFEGEGAETTANAPSPHVQLTHFQNVTGSVMQDALAVWADLWGELQSSIARDGTVASMVERGFTPSCGWPEFMDKMWVLRTHLDFVARFSRQEVPGR